LVQQATTAAKWLVGLSGVALALTFTLYIQAYLSIPLIKDDCASRRFVADAMWGADRFGGWVLIGGALALFAVALPGIVSIGRKQFDGWSQDAVMWVFVCQIVAIFVSFLMTVALIALVLIWAPDSTPEGVQRDWHSFELKCLRPDQMAHPPKATD
jgi:hypothetical protein